MNLGRLGELENDLGKVPLVGAEFSDDTALGQAGPDQFDAVGNYPAIPEMVHVESRRRWVVVMHVTMLQQQIRQIPWYPGAKRTHHRVPLAPGSAEPRLAVPLDIPGPIWLIAHRHTPRD